MSPAFGATIGSVLVHVVNLRFHSDTPDGQVDRVVDLLRTLPPVVPSIRHYEVGRDLGLADDNADIVVTGHFDDVDGYQEYSGHPAHRRIIEDDILPYLETRIATQYER